MKLFTGIILVALAIAVVGLGMAALAYSKRVDDVTVQLVRSREEVRELRGFRRRTPLSWEESLREFSGQQEVPYPRFFGGGPGGGRFRTNDSGQFGRFSGERERRRQATDLWFQETIAGLKQRAQTAGSKSEAEMATRIADALDRLNALRPKWDEVRQMPEDTRREAAQHLYAETSAVLASIASLREQDRQLRLVDLARSIGVTESNAVEGFVASVTGVYTNTDYSPGRAMSRAASPP